jgi:hypothetical protein
MTFSETYPTLDAFEEFLDELRDENDDYVPRSVSWSGGGTSGASCWDDSPSLPYSGAAEPEFNSIFTIMEAVAPDISFLRFSKLMRSAVVKTRKSEYGDYYGNYDTTNYKEIDVEFLYDWLKGELG